MAGIHGFEPWIDESKSSVLPLHHIPIKKLYIYIITQPLFYRSKKWTAPDYSAHGCLLKNINMITPTPVLQTTRLLFKMVLMEGFEPSTYRFVICCSIQLSYTSINGPDDRTRTCIISLPRRFANLWHHIRIKMEAEVENRTHHTFRLRYERS